MSALQNKDKPRKLVVVTGLAGSGKTIAIRALEDLGYSCIDNLPSGLFDAFVDALASNGFDAQLIGLALDSRDPSIPTKFVAKYDELQKLCDMEILFLEARHDVVLKRFRETRRLHPLSRNAAFEGDARSLNAAIDLDTTLLAPLHGLATRIVDTSEMTAQYLRQLVRHEYAPSARSGDIQVNLISFGFKYGIPQDVETIFDVRCFANPHYVDALRPLTGLSGAVKDYVFADANVAPFIERVSDLLKFLYPLYRTEGKRYLGIGIGCTGGKHRSVAIVEELSRRLAPEMPAVTVEHRHFDRE